MSGTKVRMPADAEESGFKRSEQAVSIGKWKLLQIFEDGFEITVGVGRDEKAIQLAARSLRQFSNLRTT